MSQDSILLDIAPEMSSVSGDKRARILALASLQVNFGTGDIKDLAIAYLAAHMLTMANRSGAAGQIISESEGDLSRSFGNVSSVNAYGQTGYGQEYVRLRNMYSMGVMTRQGI
jgi:hypothetical protein